MQSLIRDLRYALRMMAANKGFTAVALLALALGIGGNTAIFSVVDAVLLQPLPYRNPDQLVFIYNHYDQAPLSFDAPLAAPEYIEYRQKHDLFQQISVIRGDDFNLTSDDSPERILGSRVSASFFDLLGVPVAAGRSFAPEDDRPGFERVVVISDGLWRRRFGGDRGILGQAIPLNGQEYTVVGIAQPGFRYPQQSDLWTPIALTPELLAPNRRGNQYLVTLARLPDGVSFAAAEAQMKVIGAQWQKQFPDYYPGTGWRLRLETITDATVGKARPSLLVLLGAVGFVLLIACANVANLMLARATSRHREIAIRTALGASRGRIIRQLMTESTLLSFAGALLGILFALWAIDMLRTVAPPNFLPPWREIGINSTVLAFTTGLAALSGILSGLVPALQSGGSNVANPLKEGGRGGTAGRQRQRARGFIIIGEVALVLILLTGSGLMMRSLSELMRVNPGFDAANRLTVRLTLPRLVYKENSQIAQFYTALIQRLKTLPGIQAAGAIQGLPFSGEVNSGSFQIERRTQARSQSPHADIRRVTPDYFATMSIPLRNGRWFEDRDGAEAPPVVVIDETLAKTYWPNENAVGKRITRGDPQTGPWATIIGVVGRVQHRALDAAWKGVLYMPHAQAPSPTMTLVVHTAGDPLRAADLVRSEVQALDKNQPIYDVKTMDQRIDEWLATRRATVLLLEVFSGVALILAAVGIYGVMAYSVTQRTQEIGVRMALGAERRDVIRLIVGQGLTLVVIGIVIGVISALALTRLLSTLLFGVSSADPRTYLFVATLLALTAVVASFVPARRATKVDPMTALRYE